MISKRSFLNFLYINLFFYIYGGVEDFLYHWMTVKWILLLFLSFFRNSFLHMLLEKNTEKYDFIHLHRTIPQIPDVIHYYYQASLLDAFNLYLLLHFTSNQNDIIDYLWDILFFIPKSFIFEIIFDLFHYIAHRAEHKFHIQYHSIHHSHLHPTLLTTYVHHIGDLILSNVIPFYLTFFLCQKFFFSISSYMLFMLYLSKIYIELCGHSGKDIKHIGSFVQCIWLPQLLGISLYTIDHDNHHLYNYCNYSKRFSLWDRVFGTYKSR